MWYTDFHKIMKNQKTLIILLVNVLTFLLAVITYQREVTYSKKDLYLLSIADVSVFGFIQCWVCIKSQCRSMSQSLLRSGWAESRLKQYLCWLSFSLLHFYSIQDTFYEIVPPTFRSGLNSLVFTFCKYSKQELLT
jgi:hypothetical protein